MKNNTKKGDDVKGGGDGDIFTFKKNKNYTFINYFSFKFLKTIFFTL